MIKKVLLSCIAIVSCVAMKEDTASCATSEPKKEETISVKCAEDIEKINKDGGALYWFCWGIFKAMGSKNDATQRPSHILKWLAENPESINPSTNLSYMPANQYILRIVSNEYTKLDIAFEKIYLETKDVKMKNEMLLSISKK